MGIKDIKTTNIHELNFFSVAKVSVNTWILIIKNENCCTSKENFLL